MRTLAIILLFSLLVNTGKAQVSSSASGEGTVFNEKGDFYYDKNDFEKAIVYYNLSYKSNPKDNYAILRKAEAYTSLKMYAQAEECYRIAFGAYPKIDNVYRLNYAMVLINRGKTAEANKWLDAYNKIIEEDLGGVNYISSSVNRAKLYKDSSIVIVANVEEVNSAESDVAPFAYKNKLVFASKRKSAKGAGTNNAYNLVAASYASNGKFTGIDWFNKSLNSNQNEESITVNAQSNKMFITRSNALHKGLKTIQGAFPQNSAVKAMVSSLSIDGFSYAIGHPTFNSRGNIMYFVSDAGGNLDIYKSRLTGGKWGKPERLGNEINTKGNEISPYLFNDSILYFSSKGHGGLGGYDLFSVNLAYAEKKVKNLGADINSAADDYGLVVTGDGRTGYFSSNRKGGKGKEDIYVAEFINFKVKYAYSPRRRYKMDEDKVNLYLSTGKEFNIESSAGSFNFSFQPMQNYKMVIRKEDIEANSVLNNKSLSAEQRAKEFMSPTPLQAADIYVMPGMKYDFAAGSQSISNEYLKELDAVAGEFQTPNQNAINLTALAKEMDFDEDGVYTIRFQPDDSKVSLYKSKEQTKLYVNGEEVGLTGESFFIILPLKEEAKFNIQTNIEALKENFSPKKNAVFVDKGAVFKSDDDKWLISMTVNTENRFDVSDANRFTAEDVSIVPGAEYILTLSKKDPNTGEDNEIIVPLTHGVKYNLTSGGPNDDYREELAAFLTSRESVELANEELIDISFLSKVLEVAQGEKVSFNLLPAKQFNKKPPSGVATKLTLDGKEMDISKLEKYVVNVPFRLDRSINIQTDIQYLKDNFEAESFSLDIDTISFFFEMTVDTTGYGEKTKDGWLVSMNINANSKGEVAIQNQRTAGEVSIIPGKEYILTVSKKDKSSGEESEIIVPLTRMVRYDFTSNPKAAEEYKQSLEEFIEGRSGIKTTDGEVIDISLLSKELQIKDGDEVSFSLLPVKDVFGRENLNDEDKSKLFLDDEVVEFTHIQKYSINVPLSDEGKMNIQTNVKYIEENFAPEDISLNLDTLSFFFEMEVSTSPDEITDPVFDMVTVMFDLNKYEVRPTAQKIIMGKVVNELKADNRLYVTIKGYTDALGDADYNKQLSKKRAESVKAFLTKNGIGDSRIRTFSFGESKALEEGLKWEDLSESELKKHRKVEIVIYLPEEK